MNFTDKSNNEDKLKIFKKKLRTVLEKYNTDYKIINATTIKIDEYYVNMNNSKKYYCYICNKSDITIDKTNYKTLYFFSPYTEDEFYIEIDDTNTFEQECLFEGYMYKDYNYLVTDILYLNDKTVKSNYKLRQFILYEIIYYDLYKLKNLNGQISIGIHPTIPSENIDYIEIAINNFKYREEINAKEIIEINKLEKTVYSINTSKDNTLKKIIKTELPDVYKVRDNYTNNEEGILYIKTLNDSQKMSNLFKTNNEHILECKYNSKLNKWSPIIS